MTKIKLNWAYAIDWLIANGHFNKEYYNEENNVQ